MIPALALSEVRVTFPGRGGRAPVAALKGVTLSLLPGECLGLVGESGSGKSSLARVAAGLLRPDSGQVAIAGERVGRRRDRAQRRRLQMVFQDPYGSLDPTFPVGAAVREGLDIHRLGAPAARRDRALAALADVGLDVGLADRRPHQLSGGQRQRAAIARALAVEPDVLILDEPTSALDLQVQAQVLNLLLGLQQRRDLAYLLISHDMAVVRHMAHRVAVLKDGEIVESGEAQAVFEQPSHPYTKRLIAAVPSLSRPALPRMEPE